MLSFKQFLKEVYLVEATAKHFPFLDPTNQHHQDLIAAYNSGHSSNDPAVPRHPGQIKSIEQLQTAVKPHLDKFLQKRQEGVDDKTAFESSEAKLIHHNPDTGVKVYQVHSQAGSCAAGASSTWCTGKRKAATDMVEYYDKGGNNSFILHFPKESKKHLRTIGAYGKFNGRDNFQDAENHTVPEHEWSRLRSEHGLDNIKHLQGVVRGIPLSDDNKEKHKKELSDKIKSGNIKSEDISHAINNNYLTDVHKMMIVKSNVSNIVLHRIARNTSDPEVHKAIIAKPTIDDGILDVIARNTSDPEVHKAIISHPDASKYVLEKVAENTEDPEVHKAIISHPDANGDVLEKVAENTEDPEVHKAIISHPDANGDVLEKVARKTNDPEVHKAIISHPDASKYVIEKVAENTEDPEVHKAIIAKSTIDDGILDVIARNTSDPEVHKVIISHPDANGDVLEKVAENTEDPEVHKAIISHPNVSKYVLEKVARKTNDPEVHKAIISHPDADGDVLEKVARKTNDPEVKRLAAEKMEKI